MCWPSAANNSFVCSLWLRLFVWRSMSYPMDTPKRKSELWLIDYLRFYVPLKNISLIWRRHHCRWRAAKFRPMIGAQGLWAGRDLYRATPTVTRDLGFSGLIRRTAPFSRLLRHTRGCGGSNPESHGDALEWFHLTMLGMIPSDNVQPFVFLTWINMIIRPKLKYCLFPLFDSTIWPMGR
jgi:hypothetical protein